MRLFIETCAASNLKKIMQTLHLNNNNEIDNKDRFFKVRPLKNSLKIRFMENFVPIRHISQDEAMIEYFGKHNCKQAIQNKPIRFGYKASCQNTPEPYQGKSQQNSRVNDDKLGKCAGTVLNLLEGYTMRIRRIFLILCTRIITSLHFHF